jgi:hypothetical protein
MVRLLRQLQPLGLAERGVAGDDHLSPGCQAGQHLDLGVVAPPERTARARPVRRRASSTNTQAPPVSLTKAPFGSSRALAGSPSVSWASRLWPGLITSRLAAP